MLNKAYQNYTIVTQRKLYDYCGMSEAEEEEFREQLWEEQTEFLAKEIKTKNVVIHFIEDTTFIDDTYEYVAATEIDVMIQYLAVKDGVDLVRFENGNLGYVAYYNGHENAFEIIPTEMTAEEFEEVGQDMDWADYID